MRSGPGPSTPGREASRPGRSMCESEARAPLIRSRPDLLGLGSGRSEPTVGAEEWRVAPGPESRRQRWSSLDHRPITGLATPAPNGDGRHHGSASRTARRAAERCNGCLGPRAGGLRLLDLRWNRHRRTSSAPWPRLLRPDLADCRARNTVPKVVSVLKRLLAILVLAAFAVACNQGASPASSFSLSSPSGSFGSEMPLASPLTSP